MEMATQLHVLQNATSLPVIGTENRKNEQFLNDLNFFWAGRSEIFLFCRLDSRVLYVVLYRDLLLISSTSRVHAGECGWCLEKETFVHPQHYGGTAGESIDQQRSKKMHE